jgi:hypothetical protein
VVWYNLALLFENLLQHFHRDHYSQIEYMTGQRFPPMEHVEDDIFLELKRYSSHFQLQEQDLGKKIMSFIKIFF